MVLNGKRNPQNAEQVFRGSLDKLISEKERDQKKNEISKNRLHTEEAGEVRGWKRFVNTAKNRCARDAPVLCMCVRKQKTGFASSR